jgi:hypothetical protein
MMYLEMRTLVRAMSRGAAVKDDFAKAIVDDNILDKPTLASRKKSLRHLTELYGLDPSKALFLSGARSSWAADGTRYT